MPLSACIGFVYQLLIKLTSQIANARNEVTKNASNR